MSEFEPIHIRYKTEVTRDREGMLGDLLRAAARRPFIFGAVGGVLGVGIAVMRSPGVIDSAPLEAAFLALIVVSVWTFLFGMMRRFLTGMALITAEVIRDIELDASSLVWSEGANELARIDNPAFEIHTNPVPPSVLSDKAARAQPWKVWVIATGDEDKRWILATKVTAEEATNYLPVSEGLEEAADERLPTHIASPFLILGRSA